MEEAGADRHAGQEGGQRENGQREQASDAEQRERGQAADSRAGVEAGGGQHAELDGGACRLAAWQAVSDRVPCQPGSDDGEPGARPQRQPLQGEVAGEREQLGGERDSEPRRVQRRQPRPRAKHGDELRQHEVDGQAGHRDNHGRPDNAFPGQRPRLRGVDRGGLRGDRSRYLLAGEPLAGAGRMPAYRRGLLGRDREGTGAWRATALCSVHHRGDAAGRGHRL
jgi:hypothetical protein